MIVAQINHVTTGLHGASYGIMQQNLNGSRDLLNTVVIVAGAIGAAILKSDKSLNSLFCKNINCKPSS